MYLVKTPRIVKPFYKDCCWNIPTEDKVLYLTFDDGPHPMITLEVVELLKLYDAKGTFFLVGENVKQYAEVLPILEGEGHAIGNHSFNHLNGWETDDETYFSNIAKAKALIDSTLFRPPYGKASKSQITVLKEQYQIIMWDVLSADFDGTITPDKCLSNVIENATKGSIVVFHDSEKAHSNMIYSLSGTLKHFTALGYKFECLPS